jgi:ABC-2 type transport system permease protein
MLRRIAAFELRYQLANPILWITAAAVFLAAFAATGSGFLAEDQAVHRNSPFELISLYVMFSALFMFVTTAFVADVVLRDDQTGFGPILRSTRIGKADYLIGRFLGALAAAALCLALLPPAAWLGTLMPWADPASLGPNRLADHLFGYFLIALPNLLVTAALFFALATVSRSMMATYLGVLLFLMAYFTLDTAFGGRPELALTMEMADPFGRIAFKDQTRYWTPAERNSMLPDFAGILLWNRLLWIGLALLILAAACFFYRFADKGLSRRSRRKLPAASPPPAVEARSPAPLPSPRHGRSAGWALLRARAGFEMNLVFRSPAFILLMVFAMCTCFFALITDRDPEGRPSWPVTFSLIPELEEIFAIVPMIIVVIYAGELVWRDRDRKVHELIDAAPYPNWAAIVPKVTAIGLVLLAIFVGAVAAAVTIQLAVGHTRLELGKYALWYVLPMTADMLLFTALAVFVQAVSPHKVVGWGIMILYVAMQVAGLGPDHNLLAFGGTPPVPHSDMNGPAAFLEGPWIFRLYWAAFALLLLVAAHLMWPRGTETRFRPRLKLASRRLAGAPGMVALAALLTFGSTGAYAWWNTDVLNGYRSPAAQEAYLAEYEKRYLRFERLPQPEIVDVKLHVALYPSERRAVTKGRYRLRNLSGRPIRDIHVKLRDHELDLAGAAVEGGRLVLDDPRFDYRIYRLDSPMRSGEERVLAFETKRHHRGFRNAMPVTSLVENGSMLQERELMPFVGMDRDGLLDDRAARLRAGLRADPGPAGNAAAGKASATADIVVSTAADQSPIAPGRKVADSVRGGRRIARFVSDRPIPLFFAVQSARYSERHRLHGGIDLAVYHHPGHGWNVDRMLDGLAASLDYFQASFGPYQFGQARIVEFPGYRNFAKGSPNTIPFSETMGFIADQRDPATFDYPSLTVAHEMAHQYWGNQLVPAGGPGAGFLTETLAQYSAAMVTRRRFGPETVRRLLGEQRDSYLAARGGEAEEELPLVGAQGQRYIIYQKGVLAMYLLQERLGEAAVNRALRKLLERHRFRGRPFARPADLVAAFRAEARTPGQQALITDLFERITIYDLAVEKARAVRRPDGRWDVEVAILGRKSHADGQGREWPSPLDEPIEIALFTAEPGSSPFDRRNVATVELRPIRNGRQHLRFVTDRRPARAVIDPYNLYIDRNLPDNSKPVD